MQAPADEELEAGGGGVRDVCNRWSGEVRAGGRGLRFVVGQVADCGLGDMTHHVGPYNCHWPRLKHRAGPSRRSQL